MKIARFVLCAVMAICVVGCPSKPGPAALGKVNVTFWHAMGGPLGDALKGMVDEFERENPDVHVELISMGGYSTLSQKLMGAVQVNAPPNMAQMYESWTSQFHQLGKLVVLDSIVKGPDGLPPGELADFYPAFVEDNSWDSRLVTLPFNKSVPVFFYNIEMLRAAGYEKFPGTWDEFRVMVKKLTDSRKGIWGTVGGVNSWMFGCMLRQLGGDFMNAAWGKATFNEPPGVQAADYMYQLVAVDSSAMFGVGYDPQNDFLQGKIACIWGTSVSWAFMQENMTFPVGIAKVPTWQQPNVVSFGTNIGIFRTGTAEQVKACWRFIKWFTSAKQQAAWATKTFYVPARRSSLQEPAYKELLGKITGLEDELAQLEYMSFEPKDEAWFNGRKALDDALEKIMRGEVKAQAALDEAAAELQKELAK